jgi:hydrogenase expression/formation protein HypC
MCLAIPGKVVEIFQENDVLMGAIDFGGVIKRACLEHVPDVRQGEFVIVHVGYALSKVDECEAAKIFEFLKVNENLDELDEAP